MYRVRTEYPGAVSDMSILWEKVLTGDKGMRLTSSQGLLNWITHSGRIICALSFSPFPFTLPHAEGKPEPQFRFKFFFEVKTEVFYRWIVDKVVE